MKPILVFALAVVFVAGCTPPSTDQQMPKTKLIGKWNAPQGIEVYFEQSGLLVIEMTNGACVLGSYSFKDDSQEFLMVMLPPVLHKYDTDNYVPPHTNEVVAWHRQGVPNDPRSDDSLTIAYGDSTNGQNLLKQYPVFSADYKRLKGESETALRPDLAGDLMSEYLPPSPSTNWVYFNLSFPSVNELLLAPCYPIYTNVAFIMKRATKQ